MQGSNSVSNNVLWARIKKKKKKKRDRKAISKGLFYNDASWKTILPGEKALIVMMAMVRNTCWNNKRECRENYTYIYIYIELYISETVFGYIVSGWERCFSGLCNCPVWLETDNILTDAYQTTSAVSALLMLLHPITVHRIPPSEHRDHKFSVVCEQSPNSSHKFRLGLEILSFNTHVVQNCCANS